jgi:hypothetical protein
MLAHHHVMKTRDNMRAVIDGLQRKHGLLAAYLEANQSIFLAKDEIGNMMLDNVFGIIDEQIDLAESRISRGERPAVVFAAMRAAMARMRSATY